MRVLFAGGGTGGHLYPVLVLAQALLRGTEDEGVCTPPAGEVAEAGGHHAVLVVGSEGHLDEQLLTRDGVPYTTVRSRPLAGRGGLQRAVDLAANAAGVVQALPVVSHFRPDVIVGSGGFACVPAVLAGALLRASGSLRGLRIALIEPNVVPGAANRRLARFADEVWGAYPDSATAAFFGSKFVPTGIPVRTGLQTPMPREQARRSLGLDASSFTVLAFGGSQGARSINLAVSGMVARRRLPSDWQVLHVTGQRDYEWMAAERKAEPNANRYLAVPYLDSMPLAYWAADVAVCRAGASTVAELCAAALPALLVPYPHAADGHQAANAEYLCRHGAAVSIADAALSADALYWQLMDLARPEKRDALRSRLAALAHPDAARRMLARLLEGATAGAATV
jgi:UDP-N-acetylglucosamine--N-acetylmuramyl-(pentapeptide) pyrophosphoryl-undecaprenol N-acetylglucosamine transferase